MHPDREREPRPDSREFVLNCATTLIYLSLALSLLFTSPDLALNRSEASREQVCSGPMALNAYCIAPFGLVRWVSVFVFTTVLVGFRSWTLLFAAVFMAWSFSSYNVLLEGGDQIAGNLSLLLLPYLMVASNAGDARRVSPGVSQIATDVSLWAIRFQAVAIYGQAAIDKIRRPEWYDGTAMYYWARGSTLQQGEPWFSLMQTATSVQIFTNALTWGVIVLELCLALAILMTRRVRTVLFFLGILFHLGIAVYYGLVTFSIAAAAVLTVSLLFDSRLIPIRSLRFSRFTVSTRKGSE